MGRGSLAVTMTLVMILHLSSPALLEMEGGDRGTEARDSSLDILMLGNSYTSTNSLAVRLDSILTPRGLTPLGIRGTPACSTSTTLLSYRTNPKYRACRLKLNTGRKV